MTFTAEEISKFEQWIVENVDETVVPLDEGNGDALAYNLLHLLLGDNQQYDYLPSQDAEIELWQFTKRGK